MRLSPSYRSIQAVFDSPVDYALDPGSTPGVREYRFQVGGFSYEVNLYRDSPGVFKVEFKLDSDSVTEEKLAKHLSKIHGKVIDHDSRLFWETLHRVKDDPFSLMGTGQAYQVFSHVVQILRDFARNQQVLCLKFAASPESRARLYQALIRRFFPDHLVEISKHLKTTYFEVCRPHPKPEVV